MIARDGRPVTHAEAHTAFSLNAGTRRVATQYQHSNRLGRLPMTVSDAARMGGNTRAIDDDRGLCETPSCRNRQLTASNPLCRTCIKEKNKCKIEEDEELGARICAECDKEIVGRVLKGCCERCYKRQYNKTGRVVDPATKLCTHVSVCDNKEYLGGLCRRHYNERRLELIAASEYAAAASAATAPKERRSTKG